MHPYKISVLGESYLFFSLPFGREVSEYARVGERCVFLLPSASADFRVFGYEKNGKPLYDYYAAAVCAAAHLTIECGLPLSEFSFETPKGILKIIYTGNGYFNFGIDKCKLLLSNHIEICGCTQDVFEVDTGGIFRVVPFAFDEGVGEALLSRIAGAAFPLPQAVILSTLYENTLSIKTYADYNPTPPSSLLCFVAAAFAVGRVGAKKVLGKDLIARVGFSSVEISLKPILYD